MGCGISKYSNFITDRRIDGKIIDYQNRCDLIEVIKNSRIAQINQKTAISQFDSVQNKLINGKDFKEGLKSFLEKREPYFRK